MRVEVELIAAKVVGDLVRFAVKYGDCARRTDPEATARAALATHFPALWLRDVQLHSPGWRFADEHLVLTYIAYSDEFETAELPFAFPLARITDEEWPAAQAAHALRHLAHVVADRVAAERAA